MTHLPCGYFVRGKFVDTSLRTSSAVTLSPSKWDGRRYFACGASHIPSAVTTANGDCAVLGQMPTCPKCLVLWDQALENMST